MSSLNVTCSGGGLDAVVADVKLGGMTDWMAGRVTAGNSRNSSSSSSSVRRAAGRGLRRRIGKEASACAGAKSFMSATMVIKDGRRKPFQPGWKADSAFYLGDVYPAARIEALGQNGSSSIVVASSRAVIEAS